MTGQELTSYIRNNKLENAELDEHFTVVLKDGSWLDYDFDNLEIRHFANPDEDWQTPPEFLTEEDALALRERIGEEDE